MAKSGSESTKVKAGEAQFRRLALALPSTIESAHMGNADFRIVKGSKTRIFATLSGLEKGYGVVMLTPEQQQEFSRDLPEVFTPVPGGWGRNGATCLRLDTADESTMRDALQAACAKVAEKL